jgi:hypothetical protein
MAQIESFSRRGGLRKPSRDLSVPSLEEDTVSTQTEQAFGLAGEDTAMSMDEYNRQQEEKRAQNEQRMLQEYLADDDALNIRTPRKQQKTSLRSKKFRQRLHRMYV